MRRAFLVIVGCAGFILSGCGGEAASNPDDTETANASEGGAAGAEQGAVDAGEPGEGGRPSAGPGGQAGEDVGANAGEAGSPSEPDNPDGTSAGTADSSGGPAPGETTPPGMGVAPAPVGTRPPIAAGGGVAGEAPTPENCEPGEISTSDGLCEVQLACDNDSIYASCFDQGNGSWNCDCGGNYSYQSYQLTGVDASSACETISELCGSGEQPQYTEPEACSTDYQSQGPDYCEIQQQCGESADLGDGITVFNNNWKYANCYDDGSGGLYCQCGDNSKSRTYQISGESVANSCQLALDLCASDDELTFDGPRTCEPQYQSADSGYCDTQLMCTQSTEVSETVTALLVESEYAYCQDSGNGVSACTCYGPTDSLRFDLADSTTDISTCSDALDVCTSTDDLELSGDMDCRRTYQSAGGQWCDAQVACGQAATLGDQQLTVYGDLYLNCQRQAADSAWNCTCNSSAETGNLQLDASLDDWDACTMASEQCPDLVEVKIGGSGGGFVGVPVDRPVPLPVPAP